ncbi:MAG: hypothetical protein IJV27_13165 [Prevotella sp.]|nr:hypothetical protein [Prevotella sp.]
MKTTYKKPLVKQLGVEPEPILGLSKKDEYSPNPSYSKEESYDERGSVKIEGSIWDD